MLHDLSLLACVLSIGQGYDCASVSRIGSFVTPLFSDGLELERLAAALAAMSETYEPRMVIAPRQNGK